MRPSIPLFRGDGDDRRRQPALRLRPARALADRDPLAGEELVGGKRDDPPRLAHLAAQEVGEHVHEAAQNLRVLANQDGFEWLAGVADLPTLEEKCTRWCKELFRTLVLPF